MFNHEKENKEDEPKKGFRPLAYVFAFFNPISREDLKETFNKADKISNETNELLEKSRELHRKIDESLSKNSSLSR